MTDVELKWRRMRSERSQHEIMQKVRGQTVVRGGNVMRQAQHHWAWLWASPPLTDWPENGLLYGPSLCVVCARHSYGIQCLARNQELWPSHKLTWDTRGSRG